MWPGLAGRPGQQEGALERDEDVVGQRVHVDVGAPPGGRLAQQAGDALAPGHDGLHDRLGGAVEHELALGEDRDVEAARLRGHDLVGAVLEVPQERVHPSDRVVARPRARASSRGLEVADVGRGVPLDQRVGRGRRLDSKWWKNAPFERPRRRRSPGPPTWRRSRCRSRASRRRRGSARAWPFRLWAQHHLYQTNRSGTNRLFSLLRGSWEGHHDRIRTVRHRRRTGDRPDLPPRLRPARLRGVPAASRTSAAAKCSTEYYDGLRRHRRAAPAPG